jgi:hypothetical protein
MTGPGPGVLGEDVTPDTGEDIDAPPRQEAYANAPDLRRETHQGSPSGPGATAAGPGPSPARRSADSASSRRRFRVVRSPAAAESFPPSRRTAW